MRLALKNTLFLLVGYGTVLLVLGAVAVFQLLMLQASDQKETARLFAREVAGALTQPSLERLLGADHQARENLRTLIEQLTSQSQVVNSISVIDRNGHVVDSDPARIGRRQRTPEEYFGPSTRMRFTTFGAFPFYSGRYELAVPLVEGGRKVGYLQIDLRSKSVAAMNQRMWNSLLSAALVGLLCITALGFALHFQLARRGRSLARTLEAALRGESPLIEPDLDEFSQAIETAGRAGREKLRAETRESQRVARLGQALQVGVILQDAAGDFAYASPRALELFGCENEEALRASLARIQPDVEKALRHAAASAQGARVDVEPPGQAGARLRLEVHVLEPGEGEGRVTLVRDRATLRALETDLRLASQLRGLARLYLSVAHDIRAPLGVMVAHVELLRESLEKDKASLNGAGEQRQEYLTVLDQEMNRLRRSLDSLLDHATLPRDQLDELDARELVTELEGLLRPQCQRQKVVLTSRIPEQPVRVLGARDALKQALLNLGINALEAMPQGGTLELGLNGQDSTAVISVADSGPGIPPELADKIFGMHFTTKPDGSGIGLHVARAVVEASGGAIEVCSETGRGATFKVALPALSKGD